MRLALAFILAPTLAIATPYDGVFKQTANSDCGIIGVDGGSLQIKEGIFYGVEVQCRMTRPVDVINMDATLYTMQCSGDDQIWTERVMLMNAAEDDGIIMIYDGYAFAYNRCEVE